MKDYQEMYRRLKNEILSSYETAQEQDDDSDYETGYLAAWEDAVAFVADIEGDHR